MAQNFFVATVAVDYWEILKTSSIFSKTLSTEDSLLIKAFTLSSFSSLNLVRGLYSTPPVKTIMGIGIGLPKYIIGVLLSAAFIPMYIFGAGIITLFKTFEHIFTGDFVSAFLQYYIYSQLPPTSIEVIFTNAIVGAVVAGFSWFFAMAKRGMPL